MAKNIKRAADRQAAHESLTYEGAFELLDRVETAMHRLSGTAAVAALIARAGADDDAINETLDRWLADDRAELGVAYRAAFEGILGELPGAPGGLAK